MGREKYLKEIKSLFAKSPVVSAKSINRLIQSKKKVKQYNKQLIRNLLLKGAIKKLAKGFYTIHGDPSLAVFCFEPAYLGLQDALSAYNLWEQETIPIIITSKKVRQGIRKILGANVLIRRMEKKYLFGFDYAKSGELYYPVADVEKTFIDMVYFKQRMDKDLLGNFKKRINKEKLKSYLKKYPKPMQTKILALLS
ncbi:hypothetical protein HY643_00760 [Candidatus Woesearchaeota archaeon]|nr:hypothetical protein [Candidatus Woesearchaeota archaeon]